MRPASLRLRQFLQPEALMFAALIVLLGCIPLGAALVLYTLHSEAEIEEAENNAEKTAILLLRSFEQTVEPIDSLLQNFATDFDPNWTPTEIYDALRRFNMPTSIVQIAVTDKNGMLVASNLAQPGPQKVDLSDREHVRVHMTGGLGEQLFISKPVFGRVSKAWTVQFTRPLKDLQGRFAGVVVASYSIADFINFYKQLRIEDNMLIALVGFDGIVRARAAGVTSFGDDVNRSASFQTALNQPGTPYAEFSVLDGIKRIGFMVRSDRYPIIVEVAYDEVFIRQQTMDFRNAIWGTAIGLGAALLLVGLLAGRYIALQNKLSTRELQEVARQREIGVLDAISRVPGISVLHVTKEGTTEIGGVSEGPLPKMVRNFVSSDRFRNLTARLQGPSVNTEHFVQGVTEFEVEVVVAPLNMLEAGKSPLDRQELVVFAVDQTSKRMEENKLYQMSKLASLGEVATGLAHEINQPLGVIRLAATNALAGMKRGLPADHLESKLNRIVQQTARMSRIIDHMRIFGRKSTDDLAPSDPADAIDGALQVVGEQFRLDNISVSLSAQRGAAMVLCRQDQLEQVLINLLQNARDALRDRRARHDPELQGMIAVSVALDSPGGNGQTVSITVKDNAGGIPDGVIEKIFQPFFTTKPPGQGTGLGLSVSFGIIRDHHGTLTARNEGLGAVFTIRLPAAPAGDTGFPEKLAAVETA